MTAENKSTLSEIKSLLCAAFQPSFIEVIDDSNRHKNHIEAKKNPERGHFILRIASVCFKNKNRINQHRMIYEALDSIMPKIHALNIHICD